MPHKNWQAICKIADPNFRLLLATTKDPWILAGLENGFREDLFSPEETALRVPASALREAARRYSAEEHASNEYVELDAEISWAPILDEFSIPEVGRWSKDYRNHPVPDELLRQLTGQRFEAGMTVEYRGIRCLVAYISDSAGVLHQEILSPPETDFLVLISADCIDLNA